MYINDEWFLCEQKHIWLEKKEDWKIRGVHKEIKYKVNKDWLFEEIKY